MKVKFDPKINVGSIITIATIIVSLVVGGFGIYYGMVNNLASVTKQVAVITVSLDNLKENVADMKTSGAVQQANQVIISKQIDAVQNQIATLQRIMMDKQNTTFKGKDL